MKPVLSKSTGWILLAALVFIDALLDAVISGGKGSPFWKPIADIFEIKMVPLLAPVVLALFYFVVKTLGWLVQKIDKTPRSEELILTIVVVVYGIFDVWLIARILGFNLITNYRLMIIPLTIIGLVYGLWAQKKLKTAKNGTINSA